MVPVDEPDSAVSASVAAGPSVSVPADSEAPQPAILNAVRSEKDPDIACRLNVEHAVDRLKKEFSGNLGNLDVEIEGAVYDMMSGEVRWLRPAEAGS